jgi:aspartyl-tRNA(Asn)/glutamyl-tRNA(Gln) amidotransferase subunit C
MDITREEVIKLAELSMLEFNDKEIDALTRDFKEFLGYVQEIMAVDIAGEQNSVQRINVFREDKAIAKEREDILNQAPSRCGDYFAVPSILETPED